jgi:hypothetical protein
MSKVEGRFPIIDIDVSNIGVQIIVANEGKAIRKSYKPGDTIWLFFIGLSDKLFKDVKEIEWMELVQVDVCETQTQYSFKKLRDVLADNITNQVVNHP